MNGLLYNSLNKLTENVQRKCLFRLADAVADLALDNLAVSGPVEAGQDQHRAVLAAEHLLGPQEPLVGHKLGVGHRPAPEDGRIPLPDHQGLPLEADTGGELDHQPDAGGLRHTLGGVEGLAGQAGVVVRLLHRQFEHRAGVFTFPVWQSFRDSLYVMLYWRVPVIQPRYLKTGI